MKGVLAVRDNPNRTIFQGVHMLLDVQDGGLWGNRKRKNSLVFIGRNLDREQLNNSFRECLAFLSILFEGVRFILLGTLAKGFIDVYLPSGTMDRFLPRNRTLAVMMAGLLGAIFPVCECAVVPVIRRLVPKGLPVSCALTYMLASPILNPITAFSTWKAFQGQGRILRGCTGS